MYATGTVRLDDGRVLGYTERGQPTGLPVIHQHGMPGSRLEDFDAGGLYESLGLRVITPDRPGYGLSDPLRGRTCGDWAADVEQLADQLGLERFGVTALSGGGVYALALAARLPDRVSAVALASCPAPAQWSGALSGMRMLSRLGLVLSAHVPWLWRAAIAIAAPVAARIPGAVIAHVLHSQPATDRRWLSMPRIRAGEVANLREATRRGGTGYAQDIAILAHPWGLDLARVTAPVRIWHGGADQVVPLAHGRRLAELLPTARLTECPGEGHMLLWRHVGEIMEWTAAAARAVA